MRSMLVTAILGAALVSLGACSSDSGLKAGATPSPGSSAGASGGPASGAPASGQVGGTADRQTTCASVQKAQSAAEAKFLVVLPKVAGALDDPSKAPSALGELRAALAEYETLLAATAGQTLDAELRLAIDGDVKVMRKAQADVQAAGTDVPKALAALQADEFKSAGEKAKAICEK